MPDNYNPGNMAGKTVGTLQNEGTGALARQTARSFERSLRDTIETLPLAAVFVSLGLGWLLGRLHRPL
jgi:hypothetical protein